MAETNAHGQLHRSLSLGHVFSLSTGAMISSGLFLLPGLAVTKGGPSTVLAYLVAGIFAIPAMLSVAELSTAMPRSGGAYYFLERALGPAVGTVAGVGTWLSLVLKGSVDTRSSRRGPGQELLWLVAARATVHAAMHCSTGSDGQIQ